jgi:nitrate/TMAO reductase-like tetraheme cytochrome c subunit
MTDCPEAEALADFLYWSQTSTIAAQVADRHVPHQIWLTGMSQSCQPS